jgi:hypothetical protein
VSKPTLMKLGWLPDTRLHVIGWPDGLWVIPNVQAPDPEVILAFVLSVAEVTPRLEQALPLYRRGQRLWFAYPKRTGAIRTDVTRDHGWTPLAEAGLIAVTQVAIDDTWSALRFRHRDEVARITRRELA